MGLWCQGEELNMKQHCPYLQATCILGVRWVSALPTNWLQIWGAHSPSGSIIPQNDSQNSGNYNSFIERLQERHRAQPEWSWSRASSPLHVESEGITLQAHHCCHKPGSLLSFLAKDCIGISSADYIMGHLIELSLQTLSPSQKLGR